MFDGGQAAVTVFAVGIVLTIVAILTVGLRLHVKRLKSSNLGADDYLIVLGLVRIAVYQKGSALSNRIDLHYWEFHNLYNWCVIDLGSMVIGD